MPQTSKRTITIKGRDFSLWQVVVSILFVLLVISSVVWFFNNYERVTKTNYKLTERAVHNPYWAAELLINRQGEKQYRAENLQDLSSPDDTLINDALIDDTLVDDKGTDTSVDSYATTLLDSDIKSLLDDLPLIDDTSLQSGQRPVLIINSMATKLSQDRFDALQAWIENGGHLITFTGNGIDEDDFDELTAYLDTLQSSNAEVTTYQNDSTLNSMISDLGASNQFLAQLGILAVRKSSECDTECSDDDYAFEEAEMMEAIQRLEDEYGIAIDPETGKLKAKDDSKDNTAQVDEAKLFQTYLEELKSNKALAVATVPDYVSEEVSQPLLIKNTRAHDVIDTQIFGLKYPDAVVSTQANTYASYKKPSYQVNIIRQYLQRELKRFEQKSAQAIASATVSSSTQGTIKLLDYKDETLKRFIRLLLALEDDELLHLFAPASEFYVDVPLGEGRISVLLDRDTFTNPDPNFDVTAPLEGQDAAWSFEPYSIELSEWTPLIELMDVSYRYNLGSEDNVKLLLELTKSANNVWILPDTDIESLPVMLWRQAKFAVLGLFLLMIFWLWSLYDRFGKSKSLSQQKSHDILRYFHQVGRYGWDKDKANTLIRQSRQQSKLKLYEQLPRLAVGQSFSTDIPLHTLTDLHAENPNANPLASWSDKDLDILSGLLFNEYQKKYESGYADSSSPLLISPQNKVTYLDNAEVDRQVDAQSLLSPEYLRQALITPLSETYSAQTLLEITQTLWLLNWVLK